MARRVARRSKAVLNLSHIKWEDEQWSFKTFVISGHFMPILLIIYSFSFYYSLPIELFTSAISRCFLIHTCVDRPLMFSQTDSNIFATFHGNKRYVGSTTGLFASAIYRLHLSCFFPRPRSDRAPGKRSACLSSAVTAPERFCTA